MASSSGTSSGSSALQTSGSKEDLRVLMDQKKRKRIISNRESARRSRIRKQKHLDDLMDQVAQMEKVKRQIITSISLTTQHYLNVEAENSILRAQMDELSHRLLSLNEIINFMNASNNAVLAAAEDHTANLIHKPTIDNFMNQMNFSHLNGPIMASADMFPY